ncbi:MAG TPA: sulfatase-like hydrolase/transferase [Candidatus Onthocola stercoravium]|nr:sulfatase-like hydrolase/transferase [Candidatus Onthocola stercoravium]
MKKLLNNNLIKNFLIILVFTFLLEITFRLISGSQVFDVSLIRIILGLSFISLILSFILSWTNKTCSKVIIILVSLVFTIYSFLQLGFNNFIGVYMSFNTSSQLGAVTSYIKEFLLSFLGKFYFIFIPFILLVLYYIFLDKFTERKFNKKFVLKSHIKYEPGIRIISTVLVLFVIGLVYNGTLTAKFMQNELQTVNNEELFQYPSVPSLVINEFGVIGFGLLDIKSLYVDPPDSYVFDATDDNISFEDTNRTFDDTLWEKLIEEETDKSLNNINNYLINNTITDYNDHTGMFEGKNLIVIMMESVNEIFINPDLYPNFYKMYSEGISFTNNYSPRNSCATGNNEFSAMTGLYSIQNNCTANIYRDNTYSTAIFNLFNNAGYKTSSMHDYTEYYYYRNTIHTNMGSGRYYGVQDLGIPYFNEYKNWASDEDFMDVAMDITLSDTTEPFMLWLTTVSSHQPYNQSSVEGDKYLSITEGTDYPDDLRRYMSKLKTLDNALGILLDRLESAGILDDTVIVLFGDHYPYGLKDTTINQVLDYDLNDYEREKTPLVIYNSEIEPEVVDKYTSYVNLTPTIANLFGINYDPRLYMGSDVFDENYWNLVAFADGSWKNDLVYYNAATSEVKYYTDELVSYEEIRRINGIITAKMQMSSAIIQNNYYEYLSESLARLASEQETYANAEAQTEDYIIGG